ncbi:MAG: copper-binding protein [Thiobacillaceae bacterium]|jgi:Cu/Ag efflux protein CusF|nr:copper-binding protein [Thiobacillaceae bacterium]
MKALLIPLLAATFIASTADAEPVTAPVAAASTTPMSEAVVRKVDPASGKITLRHGPIANFDMPPMTMVFQVSEAALLGEVRAGDKVRFSAERIGGAYTLTAIEVLR